MQNRLILAWVLAVFMAGTIGAKAGLGWTFDECKQHYGEPVSKPIGSEGKRKAQLFFSKGYNIVVWFLHDRVSRVCYGKKNGEQLSVGEVNDLLTINAPQPISLYNQSKAPSASSLMKMIGMLVRRIKKPSMPSNLS